jgi:hypothetical protein
MNSELEQAYLEEIEALENCIKSTEKLMKLEIEAGELTERQYKINKNQLITMKVRISVLKAGPKEVKIYEDNLKRRAKTRLRNRTNIFGKI